MSAVLLAAGMLCSLPAGAQELAATPAESDTGATKAQCVTQLDHAQSMHSARRLTEARTSYLACSAGTCPALVREDCARSLVELDATMPTVVFSARADGRDVTNVRVVLDGATLTTALEGRAVALDPGSHLARFERAGGGVVEIELVAREGEKNRAVAATFVDTSTNAHPRAESGRVPVLPILLGGTGLLALGGSFYVRLSADADADAMRRSCAPSCDPSSRDALGDKLVVANVALGVGIGVLALAAATWLFDPRH
jgi:hypothetical protein